MARRTLPLLTVLLATSTSLGAALADPLDEERLVPGIYPASPAPPPEPAHPPVDIDWSLGLKGSYTVSTEGTGFITTLTPGFSATRQGVRTDVVLDGGANLTRGSEGALGVTSANLTLGTTTRLDTNTTFIGTAGLRFGQELPGTLGLNAAIIEPPAMVSGSLGGSVARRFGQFNLGASGELERTVYGTTNRTDSGVTDNSSANVWEGDARLRLGLQATPIFEVFGEAGVGRDWFDHASATGTKPDATSTALRAGVAGNWNGVWSASASLGIGRHDFDDASLADITTRLYDASLTYSPDSTINLTGRLSTEITPTGADSAGTARVTHAINADASYTVNSWLRLRGSANWSHATTEGGGDTEVRNGIGAAADYKVNTRTAVSADYGYEHRDNSASGTTDSHTISLGVTVKR